MAVAWIWFKNLTPTEQVILQLLQQSDNWVRGYDLAGQACQGSTNRLQADSLARWHISHIRRKLGSDVILSRKGMGYRLNI